MRNTNDTVATILECISDAFFALDREWCFTYVNNRAEILLQKTREVLLGRNVWEEFPGSTETIFYEKYNEAIATQNVVQFEDYYVPVATWFEVRVYPSYDGLAIYFRDITQRKQAEGERERLLKQLEAERATAEAHARQVEAVLADMKKSKEQLRVSEERFRLLCDNAPIGIAISRNTDNMYVNQAFVTMFGYDSTEELLSRSFLELVPPESREQILMYIAMRARGEEGPTSYETTGLRKDGSTFGLAVNVGRMPLGDDTVSITFITDITERKESEQRKDDFLSMASHELRTPLTSVKAYAQLLQRMFEKEGNLQPVQYLARMEIQLNRLTQLIMNMLDVSRLQASKLSLKKETFNFDRLVHDVVSGIQKTTLHHSISIDGSTGREIWGDRERLGQALHNLILNAVKYSPRSNIVRVSLSSTSTDLRVDVQDFGIGIPKHQQAKVFERFYRVYDDNNTTYPGLGVGLYVAREIIAQHGGTLSVESVEGEGSIFSFSLPFQHEEQKTKVS